MSHLRRSGWCRIGPILSLYIIAVFPVATFFVQSVSLSSTNFSFLEFPAADHFIFSGNSTRYNRDTLSYTIDPIPASHFSTQFACVKMYYKDKVQMKSSESSAVASFNTSFSFSITQQDQSTNRSGALSHSYGFMFAIGSESTIPGISAKGESLARNSPKKISVEFDTYHDNFLTDDPSDNHIGVNVNNIKSAYTHNLCEGHNVTRCSFPWTGRTYTAWIDYNGSTKSLELWFANGSLREGTMKPAGSGLIKVPELDLMSILDDYMYIGFSGNIWPILPDTLNVLSWNFASSYSKAMPAPTPKRSWLFSKRIVLICAACGTAILAVICLLGCWRIFRQPHIDKSEPGLGLDLLVGLQRFSLKELKKATKNFSKDALLGKGGSGSVYKGIMTPSGMVVAVKRLSHDSEHVQGEFLAEVSSMSQIRHKNLVHLQGWCHEDEHFLLVFEYMSNGSLDEWLFPCRRRHLQDPKFKQFEVLPWEIRFSILAGVAAAVDYLHEEWVQCVLHRDIKSSNVMLDENFNPHLGDFGLARVMDHKKLEKTTMMAGTFGYMAPEMHYTGKATKESDVYSFGTLMLEVLCGRRPVDLQVENPDENFMLVQNVWRAHEDGNILSAVDPRLLYSSSSSTAAPHRITPLTNSTYEQLPINEVGPSTSCPVVSRRAHVNFGESRVEPLLHLGLQCCLSDPESRPSMKVVKQVIKQVQSSTTEEDPILALKCMPPLPSPMLLHWDLQPRSSSRLPTASVTAMNLASLEEVEARASQYGGLRRRFVTN